jgi:hypothetical protein
MLNREWAVIRELVWKWDPIGMDDIRNSAEDEYECILEAVVPLLNQGVAAEDIGLVLDSMLPEHFGLNPQPAEAREFARGAIAAWASSSTTTG